MGMARTKPADTTQDAIGGAGLLSSSKESKKMRRIGSPGVLSNPVPCGLCHYYWHGGPAVEGKLCRPTCDVVKDHTVKECEHFTPAKYHYCDRALKYIALKACSMRRTIKLNKYKIEMRDCYDCKKALTISRVLHTFKDQTEGEQNGEATK